VWIAYILVLNKYKKLFLQILLTQNEPFGKGHLLNNNINDKCIICRITMFSLTKRRRKPATWEVLVLFFLIVTGGNKQMFETFQRSIMSTIKLSLENLVHLNQDFHLDFWRLSEYPLCAAEPIILAIQRHNRLLTWTPLLSLAFSFLFLSIGLL
jgi:hypothetical protein